MVVIELLRQFSLLACILPNIDILSQLIFYVEASLMAGFEILHILR